MLKVFYPGAKVLLADRQRPISGVVVRISITGPQAVSYEVAWWDGATRHMQWFSEFELKGDADGEMSIGFRPTLP